jgi:hypothetical protein
MWDCMLVASNVCVPFFLATVVIGNLVVRTFVVVSHHEELIQCIAHYTRAGPLPTWLLCKQRDGQLMVPS